MLRSSVLIVCLTIFVSSCLLRTGGVSVPVPTSTLRSQVEIRLSSIAWNHAQCYLESEPKSFRDLYLRIQECKAKLLSELTNGADDVRALRNYFDQYYPTPGDALRSLATALNIEGSQFSLVPVSYQDSPDQRFRDVARARIGQVIDGIVNWASKRLIYSVDSRRFLVNVFVESKPKDDAVFTLSYVDSTLVRSVRTNETMKEVYRGLYLFKVERDGFKTAQGPLNLVDWDWNQSGVVCVMVSQNSLSEPFPCNPQ